MATPISNDHSAAIANNRSVRSEGRGSQGQAHQAAEQAVSTPTSEAAVNVSRAAEVLNQAPADRGQGNIQSAEHAAAVASQIKELFQDSPANALAGQAGGVSADIMALLEAG